MADAPVMLARRRSGGQTTHLLLVLVVALQMVSIALELQDRRDEAAWRAVNCPRNLGSAFPSPPADGLCR